MSPQSQPKRRRDPDTSRAAILAAAASAFVDLGYGRATIREIAARAGVTHGLVMRYFTSKEQLFIAAVPGARDLGDLEPGPVEDLPARIARAYVERMERGNGNDPFIALIRAAATDDQAAVKLYDAMRAQSVDAYRTLLGDDDADERVEMLGAHLIGITFTRYVMRSGPLAEMPADALIRDLTRTVHAILLAR